MEMLLSHIISNLKTVEIIGSTDISILSITFDSRKVEKDCMFVAIKGTQSDGHTFINQSIEKGARAILCEILPENIDKKNTYIQVADTSFALGIIASNFYNNPSAKLKLVGVTGTNGKTTTATLLQKLFTSLGYKSGLFSTVVNIIDNTEYPATHTTPDSLELNRMLSQMVSQGCEYCFMEVSSHSVVQHRIAGLTFSGGIFTNLTHDHLDYHHTFAEYLKAKKTFFDNLPQEAFALTNADDKNGKVMLQNTKAQQFNYSLKSFSQFKCKVLESHFDGMLLSIDGIEVWTHFIGQFNAYNLLAVYSAAAIMNIDKNEILTKLSNLHPVSGRFETIRKKSITAIVDYAHTPDALENVLSTINQIRQDGQNLITVVGAGGNRDKTKRPEMAKICAEKSDKVIITSDNPRNEKPEDIIEDMMAGIDKINLRNVLKIIDRKDAIKTACMLARAGDIILIAGKGHETYQEVNGVKHHFDDREIVAEMLEVINN